MSPILSCGCIPHPDANVEDIQGCPIRYAQKLQDQNEDLKKHLEIMRLAAYEGGIMLLNLLPENYLVEEEE